MRSNKIFIVLISILLVLATGCSNKTENGRNKINSFDGKKELRIPPTLKVLYEDKSIEAERGTYSWTIDNNDGTKAATFVDCSGPAELVKDSTPIAVPPNSALVLSFSANPVNITVYLLDNKTIKQTAASYKITAPESKGSAIYEVVATWEQGTVSYAFLVNVD